MIVCYIVLDNNMACTKVSYKYLGNTGIKVSNICLGTMNFGDHQGGPLHCLEDVSHKMLDKFAEYGGNFIDTADVYKQGKSEEILGNWLKKQERHKFFIASKVRGNMDPSDLNAVGLTRGHIMHAVDESLRRLQTDYIDLYQIHAWDDATPIEETLSALNDLVSMGKVRYLGASNVFGWQMQKIVDISKHNAWVPWVSLQQQYSLLVRETEFELVDVCKNEGIGMLPWSPLKGGWLTGKFKRNMDSLPENTRLAWVSTDPKTREHESHPGYELYAKQERTWTLLDKIEDIAKIQNKSVAQVSLRWLIQKDFVSSVIIGAKTMEQFEDNIGASSGWELTPQQMQELDDASQVTIPYPYNSVKQRNVDRQRKFLDIV